jgi:hypothetical protein
MYSNGRRLAKFLGENRTPEKINNQHWAPNARRVFWSQATATQLPLAVEKEE